jgi:SAM-dependent methyltransferase
MNTRENKKKFRSDIFRHLDGIATCPTAFELYKSGILTQLSAAGTSNLGELARQYNANEGYLNVALRVLCSQGWCRQTILDNGKEISFEMTRKGKIALDFIPVYEQVVKFIPHGVKMEEYILKGFTPSAFNELVELFNGFRKSFGLMPTQDAETSFVREQVLKHIEGSIVGPLVVALGFSGLFNKYFSIAPFEVEEFTQFREELTVIIEFFRQLGWFSENHGVYNFTEKGLFFARRASAYGVTVSYLPTFMRLNELLFGNASILWEKPAGSPEIHVNRRMNVWGSGGAHSGYFLKIDEIIADIFNEPIHKQPRGFVDMGCGDGSLLQHIFEVIWTKTKRGKMLDEYPLFIIGTDFNEAALAATRNTLNKADIWAKVVWGDVSRPELLAESVKTKYDVELNDLLHVRSFLDHNRLYKPPLAMDESLVSSSGGAFAFRGRRIPNREAEQSLAEHFANWKPYISQFGLLVIELHTIDPAQAADHMGSTPSTAYDATHGFSDQYILELPLFLAAAAKAGLFPVTNYQSRFPDSDLATVSLNLLRAIK